jgi:hypothetical protein
VVAAAVLGFAVARVDSLGVYGGVTEADYSAGRLLRWLVYSFGELSFAVGVAPVCAAVLLLGARRTQGEQAFLAVTWSAVLWLLVLGSVSSSWQPAGIKERYLLYAAPLLFLGLLVWIRDGLPRPRRLAALAVGLPLVSMAALPLGDLFASPSFLGNAFGLIPLWRLALGEDETKALMLAGGLLAAALVSLVPRRLAAPALPFGVAAFLVASSVPVYTTLTRQSERVRDLAGLGPDRDWVDRAVGRGSEALFLNASAFQPDTGLGRLFETWVPVWETEFWNRSFAGVHSLGYPEPSPLHQSQGSLDWASGRVSGAPNARYVLSDPRFEVAGRSVAASEHLVLYRAVAPLRLASATEGVYRDGTTGTLAAYDRWAAARSVEVVVSQTVQPARVSVTAGRLLVHDGLPALGPILARARARVPPGAPTTVFVAAPPPPFRVELRLTQGARGAHVVFRAGG